MVRRCKECRKVLGRVVRRGLCQPCYRNPDIRGHYPAQRRGCWAEDSQIWDTYAVVVLHTLFREGLSDKEIAEKMGRSIGAVCKQRQRLGLGVSPARQATHRKRRDCQ